MVKTVTLEGSAAGTVIAKTGVSHYRPSLESLLTVNSSMALWACSSFAIPVIAYIYIDLYHRISLLPNLPYDDEHCFAAIIAGIERLPPGVKMFLNSGQYLFHE